MMNKQAAMTARGVYMVTATKVDTDKLNKEFGIRHSFKGSKHKPTERTWKLMQDSERMPFSKLMSMLGHAKTPVDRACICMSAAEKAQTARQVSTLALAICKGDQPNRIVNAIETVYPDSPAVQMLTHKATRNFLTTLLHGKAIAKRAKQKLQEKNRKSRAKKDAKPTESVRLEIRSTRKTQ